ncbi:hypothetical protein [Herbidospora galbida]|uniref:hypothetical protein n=1 Tax=Herbidospora galbida TaxID=2575442 RepID=UPI001BB06257|nr:hypothetical protein [Herbidospora galbida]
MTVSVSATDGWQDAGLFLHAGDTLIVRFISGTWTVDHRNFPHVGPAGYPAHIDAQIWQGCKLKPAAYGKLLASVDQINLTEVGAGGVFSIKQSGRLRFRIHDGDTCLGDNAGAVKVTVAHLGHGLLQAIKDDVAELQQKSRTKKPSNTLSPAEIKAIIPVLKRLKSNLWWLLKEVANDAAWDLAAKAIGTVSVLKLKTFLNPCFSLSWETFLTSKDCLKLWSLPTKTFKA